MRKPSKSIIIFPLLTVLLCLSLVLSACHSVDEETVMVYARQTLSAEASQTSAALSTHTATVTYTPQPTWDPSSTETATSTLAYPQATVLEQSNCRYGPGAPYLYEWGLFPDDRVTVTARNDLGTWVYVQPRSYSGYCWVKTSLLQIDGEIEPLPPFYGRLPYSELYKPPTNPRTTRVGDQVTIAWDPVYRTPDDDRGYLIEAWLCQDKQIVFTPLGTATYTDVSITVIDEPGCQQPSGARLYTAEKHGYTPWVKIPWPQADSGELTYP
jgi:hypothetical protein